MSDLSTLITLWVSSFQEWVITIFYKFCSTKIMPQKLSHKNVLLKFNWQVACSERDWLAKSTPTIQIKSTAPNFIISKIKSFVKMWLNHKETKKVIFVSGPILSSKLKSMREWNKKGWRRDNLQQKRFLKEWNQMMLWGLLKVNILVFAKDFAPETHFSNL